MKKIYLQKEYNNDITLMDKSKSLNKYFNEIKKYENSNVKQEREKFKLIHQGDEKAKEEMIKSHMKLVVAVAMKYLSPELEIEDLIQEGNIGLCNAIDKFDEEKGYKFSSYAVNYIQSAILIYIYKNKRLLKCPIYKQIQVKPIKEMEELFFKQHGFNMNPDFFYKECKVYKEANDKEYIRKDLTAILEYDQRHVFMGLGDYVDKDTIRDLPKEINLESLKSELQRLLSTLTQKERDIVRMYYGIDKEKELELEKIGKEFGLERHRVLQIKEKAIRKLRHRSRSRLLKAYLE